MAKRKQRGVSVSVKASARSLLLKTTTSKQDEVVTLDSLLEAASVWTAATLGTRKRKVSGDTSIAADTSDSEDLLAKLSDELSEKDYETLAGILTRGQVLVTPDDDDVVGKFDLEENKYYMSLDEEQKTGVVSSTRDILRAEDPENAPLRFRVVSSDLPMELKKQILLKLNNDGNSFGGGDATKYASWVATLLQIPLRTLIVPSEGSDVGQMLANARVHLDTVVYGHKRAKQAILEKLYHWVKNPNMPQRPLALYGPPGNGKTTLMKQGLAPIMNRPFSFVSLGGATDSNFLVGHSYAYEGSRPGSVAESLISAKCMNPVIYYDELDKVSETPKGDEIVNTLVHMTDLSQMDHFRDRYLRDLNLDLSKILFVFSFNSIPKINPILLDRLQLVETDEFSPSDQQVIVRDYLLRAVLREAAVDPKDVTLTGEAVNALLAQCDASKGTRAVRSVLEQAVSKVMMFVETRDENFLYPMKRSDLVITPAKPPPDASPPPSSTKGVARIADGSPDSESVRGSSPPSAEVAPRYTKVAPVGTGDLAHASRDVTLERRFINTLGEVAITERAIAALVQKRANEGWRALYA